MSKDPAVLFYTSDFLTGTMTMSNENVGKYIRLLCLQHQKGFLTHRDIYFVCSDADEDVIEKFIIDENGNYYNTRLKEESEKRSKFCESRRKNFTKTPHMDTHTDTHMNTHVEDENEDENIDVNIDTNVPKKTEKKAKAKLVYTAEFETFYSLYPNPFNKEQTFKNWNTTLKEDTIDNIMIALKNYKKDIIVRHTDKQFMTRSSNFIGQAQAYKGYLPSIKLETVKTIPIKPKIIEREFGE